MKRHVILRTIPLFLPLSVLLTWFPMEASATSVQRGNREEVRSGRLYRLSFTLHVFTGMQDSKREFVMTVEEGRSGRVRALTRVPMRQGTEVTYVETGVKCDAEYLETPAGIRLEVELQFSELAPRSAEEGADLPLIYEWQSQIQKIVPPNQPTVLSTYREGQGNRRYELEIMAEPLP